MTDREENKVGPLEAKVDSCVDYCKQTLETILKIERLLVKLVETTCTELEPVKRRQTEALPTNFEPLAKKTARDSTPRSAMKEDPKAAREAIIQAFTFGKGK